MDLEDVRDQLRISAGEGRDVVIERGGGNEQLLMMRTWRESHILVRFLVDLGLAGLEKGGELVTNDGVHAIQQCRPLGQETLRILVGGL